MKSGEQLGEEGKNPSVSVKLPVVVRVTDVEFQRQVLDRLGRLEAKVDMLVGDHQPGRMKLAEDRLRNLEAFEVRHSLYDRLVNAGIAVIISAAIALHDHLGLK